MKYYRRELWQKINSENVLVREEAEREWAANSKVYKKVFEELAHSLSTDFLSIYDRHGGFHDFEIKNIDFNFIDKEKSCCIVLVHNATQIRLLMLGLKKTSIELQISDFVQLPDPAWAYSEFGLQDGMFSLSVAIDFDSELYFEFTHISASEIISNERGV